MQSQRTLIVIAEVHWHFTMQRRQLLAKAFASRGYQVIYIQPLPKRWPRPSEWGRVISRLVGVQLDGGRVRQNVPDSVTIVSPRLLPDTNRVTRWFNTHLLLPRIAQRITAMI